VTFMSIGLYVHVPFCVKKCHYCDFVSVVKEDSAVEHFIASLQREISMWSNILRGQEKHVDSIYIGGGTPTCLTGRELSSIIESIFAGFDVPADPELTVEANPGTVDRHKLDCLKSAGVNRLSLGFQSCSRELLDILGRTHTYRDAVSCYMDARAAGFENINTDLIFGIPGQTVEQWQCCLNEVAGLRPDHISAYGLQLEEGTPLYDTVASGRLEECPEDLQAEMYESLMETLAGRGYIHYEISNFCLPEKCCRHNLRYWHNESYIGLGPAAHSCMGGIRYANHHGLREYNDMLLLGSLPVICREEKDPVREMSETMFLGLRLIEGMDVESFRQRFGVSVYDVYTKEIEKLAGLKLIEAAGGKLRLTKRGIMVGNMVFSEFV